MTTVEALQTAWNWLLIDWTHPIFAASAICALMPPPAPGSFAAKLYTPIKWLALNVLHAKAAGVTPSAAIEQAVAAQLALQNKVSQPVVQPEK